MNKKMLLWHILYYVLFLVILVTFDHIVTLYIESPGKSEDLVFFLTASDASVFVGAPLIIAVLMRFSLLKWYVDPIAAAIAPLWFFYFTLLEQMKYTAGNITIFQAVHMAFYDNGWANGLYFAGWFVFGLAVSFSQARKEGKSISYRLLSKLSAK